MSVCPSVCLCDLCLCHSMGENTFCTIAHQWCTDFVPCDLDFAGPRFV